MKYRLKQIILVILTNKNVKNTYTIHQSFSLNYAII